MSSENSHWKFPYLRLHIYKGEWWRSKFLPTIYFEDNPRFSTPRSSLPEFLAFNPQSGLQNCRSLLLSLKGLQHLSNKMMSGNELINVVNGGGLEVQNLANHSLRKDKGLVRTNLNNERHAVFVSNRRRWSYFWERTWSSVKLWICKTSLWLVSYLATLFPIDPRSFRFRTGA